MKKNLKFEIIKELQRGTYENPIKAATIGETLKTEYRKIQSIIARLKQHFLIGSNNNGYFIIKDEKDLEKYCLYLEEKQKGLQDQIIQVINLYYKLRN